MHSSNNAFSPFEAWSSAVMAATTATFDLATAASASAVSMWTGAVTPEGPRTSRVRTTAIPTPPPTVVEIPRASAAGRSWYKAPYRSPFDPLFWMMPGHPIDHADLWLAPMRAAAAAMPLNGFSPFTAITAFAPQPEVQPPAMWQQPWNVWTDMLSAMASQPVANQTAQPLPPANVIDFGSVYAAFRTAGGHAAAQIVGMPSIQAPSAATPAVPAAWLPLLRLYGLA